MIRIDDKKECCGCGACAMVCPRHCIKMICDEEGFCYPKVDENICIDCHVCEKICPSIKNVTSNNINISTTAYAAYTKNYSIRLESSSGGVFTEIASYIIRNGGIVFGAAFDDQFKVVHVPVEKVENLERLRGSKYVQSSLGNTYKEVQEYLRCGRKVFFTGTPCQVEGLYGYLKRDYENLVTLDLICHGVPAPMVWKKYLEYREEQIGKNVRKVSFRDKKYGWKKFSVRIDFLNDEVYESEFSQDLYMKSFLADLCLRPSCYDCRFKGIERKSDFTLADFWGIEKIDPEMDDDKGLNLVFVNSDKGKQIFDEIKDMLVYKEVDKQLAIQDNPAMIRSVKMPRERKYFIKRIIKSRDYSDTINDFMRMRLLYSKVVRIVKKIQNYVQKEHK